MNIEITPEMIEALRFLRHRGNVDALAKRYLDVLDNAGIFSAIDEATGYDVDQAPEQVSDCTCPRSRVSFPVALGEDMHTTGCPGDPAEWGDMAGTTAKRFPCPGCSGKYVKNQDGRLRAHSNDMCEPCSQER